MSAFFQFSEKISLIPKSLFSRSKNFVFESKWKLKSDDENKNWEQMIQDDSWNDVIVKSSSFELFHSPFQKFCSNQGMNNGMAFFREITFLSDPVIVLHPDPGTISGKF